MMECLSESLIKTVGQKAANALHSSSAVLSVVFGAPRGQLSLPTKFHTFDPKQVIRCLTPLSLISLDNSTAS